MKICFVFLAIGRPYYETTKMSILNIQKKTDKASFLMVTDIDEPIPNTQIVIKEEVYRHRCSSLFNYNLKFLPIKLAAQQDFDFIIYMDADWMVNPDVFNMEEVEAMCQLILNSNADVMHERNHLIGQCKRNNLNGCFYYQKYLFYKLGETDKYDDACVTNEQILAFRNSPKLKVFTEAWENRYWEVTNVDYDPYPEGVEIGMSIVDADMKRIQFGVEYLGMRNFFWFKDISGNTHKRF